MDPSRTRGLLDSVARSIAQASTQENLLDRLQAVDSREDFREFLENAPLSIGDRSRRDFIDAVTTDEEWRDWHSRLSNSADMAWHEFRSPSS